MCSEDVGWGFWGWCEAGRLLGVCVFILGGGAHSLVVSTLSVLREFQTKVVLHLNFPQETK